MKLEVVPGPGPGGPSPGPSPPAQKILFLQVKTDTSQGTGLPEQPENPYTGKPEFNTYYVPASNLRCYNSSRVVGVDCVLYVKEAGFPDTWFTYETYV